MSDFDPEAYAAQQAEASHPFNPEEYAASRASQADQTKYNPSEGEGELSPFGIDTGIKTPQWLNRTLAGAGKATVDLFRGAGQYLGLESREDVKESRRLDAPLMATTAGKVGNVAGSALNALPAAAIPGVNGLVGGAAIGAVQGALQPSESSQETLGNIGLGGATGGVGGFVGGKIAGMASGIKGAKVAAGQELASSNSARDAVLSEAKDAGYVVPPTAINPNLTNTALESISGKAATRQAMQATNQKITDRLVASDFGLGHKAITQDALEDARSEAGKTYRQVRQAGQFASDGQYKAALQRILNDGSDVEAAYPGMGTQANQKIQELVKAASVDTHDANTAVDAVRFLRDQAKGNFKSAFAIGDPEKLTLARGQQGVAEAIEGQLTRHLQNTGNPGLAKEWEAARTTIAKSYQAEAALDGSHIDATYLAAQMDKGKPVTGGMGTAARFAQHFGEVAKVPKSGAGVSKLAATVGTMGEGAALYMHDPTLAVGSAAALAAPYATRAAMMSRAGQAALATPHYGPGAISTGTLDALQYLGNRAGAVSYPLARSYGDILKGGE